MVESGTREYQMVVAGEFNDEPGVAGLEVFDDLYGARSIEIEPGSIACEEHDCIPRGLYGAAGRGLDRCHSDNRDAVAGNDNDVAVRDVAKRAAQVVL